MLKDYHNIDEWKNLFKVFEEKDKETFLSIVKESHPEGLDDLFAKFVSSQATPAEIRQIENPTKEQLEKIRAFYTMGKIMLESHFVINKDKQRMMAGIEIETEEKKKEIKKELGKIPEKPEEVKK